MDKICAIVDAQGFQFKDRFVPREVAIVSEQISQCQELNPQMYWRDLSLEDQQVIVYDTQRVHGLFYMPFNSADHCYLLHPNEIDVLLTRWYDMIATEEKPFFGFKNQQMGKILTENKIPCLDLDDKSLRFPSYKSIQEKYGFNYLCAYHKKPPKNSNIRFTCAYRKCAQMYRELQSILDKKLDWYDDMEI